MGKLLITSKNGVNDSSPYTVFEVQYPFIHLRCDNGHLLSFSAHDFDNITVNYSNKKGMERYLIWFDVCLNGGVVRTMAHLNPDTISLREFIRLSYNI